MVCHSDNYAMCIEGETAATGHENMMTGDFWKSFIISQCVEKTSNLRQCPYQKEFFKFLHFGIAKLQSESFLRGYEIMTSCQVGVYVIGWISSYLWIYTPFFSWHLDTIYGSHCKTIAHHTIVLPVLWVRHPMEHKITRSSQK